MQEVHIPHSLTSIRLVASLNDFSQYQSKHSAADQTNSAFQYLSFSASRHLGCLGLEFNSTGT